MIKVLTESKKHHDPMMNQAHPFIQALPADFAQKAYQTGAFSRARKVKNPTELLQLVMLYCGKDLSLRSCSSEVAQYYGHFSDMAVKKKLEKCGLWLQELIQGTLQSSNHHTLGRLRFLAADATTVQVRGATQTSYRIHTAMDLVTLQIQQATLTTEKIGENVNHFNFQEGDVAVLDRGYNHNKHLVPLIDRGVDIVMRYNPRGLCLYEKTDLKTKINWPDLLRPHHTNQIIPCHLLLNGKHIECWLHAVALPSQAADTARRKVHHLAKKQGKTASSYCLEMSRWVLILTSLPPTVLNTEAVLELYGNRWQIELLFKRMKSLLNLDNLRAKKGSKLAEAYLLGKLLYAIVVDKLAFQNSSKYMISQLKYRQDSNSWRHWKSICTWLESTWITDWSNVKLTTSYLKNIAERPRKRQAQQLPDQVIGLIVNSQIQGLSAYC
jgi:Transposase DDE domain